MPRRQLIALAAVIAVAAGLMLVPTAHRWLLSAFGTAERLIGQRPALGMLVFVLLAALSAMLAFVSSVVLVPAAIHVWGPAACFILLWTGWFLGGLAGYGIGRYLGRPAVELLVRPRALARYEGSIGSGKSLVLTVMLQLAIPSDMASYLFGLARCRFGVFAGALAVAELPYAAGAVYLGTSFLERRLVPLVAVGAAGALLTLWIWRRIGGRGDGDRLASTPSAP